MTAATPIAIVGMSCRFPGGADTPAAYWQVLRQSRATVGNVPEDRGWDVEALYDPNPDAPGKSNCRRASFLADVAGFDAAFFGIAPTEAQAMDPQQRLALELTWEALESAAQAPDLLRGSRTSTYMGVITCDYLHMQFQADPSVLTPYTVTGNIFSIVSGRIAHLLDLRSPSVSVNSACASSLLAVHQAVRDLRAGTCDLALAGGVNLILMPESMIILSKNRALAPDGRCKTFDARADGYGRAEGGGVVVLKRLADAVANGDDVLAIIRGTAANQDGHCAGLTVPNRWAQAELVRSALTEAGATAHEVGYVETHGTGTPLGDPIEVAALGDALGDGRTTANPLIIGACKAVIGHAEAAAGIAGLIKAVLCLRHREIPGHRELGDINPDLPLDAIPALVPRDTVSWTRPNTGRLAGISAFGFNGTNVHVIIGEAPHSVDTRERGGKPSGPHLMVLSAKSATALIDLCDRMAHWTEAASPGDLSPASVTLALGRTHYPCRTAIVAGSLAEAHDRLLCLATKTPEAFDVPAAGCPSGPVFTFTGQGTAFIGMGRELFETCDVFARIIRRCDAAASAILERSIIELLYPEDAGRVGSPLTDTELAQPTLFAFETALAAQWRAWGVEPAGVIGHSLGEFVAAHVAGILDLEDGIRLTATRGRLMGDLPSGGGMLAVASSPDRIIAELKRLAPLEIAALNGPRETVLSGSLPAIKAAEAQLSQAGISCARLKVSHAFHSRFMAPAVDGLRQALEATRLRPAKLPIASNVTGTIPDPEAWTDPDLWCRQLTQTVRFGDGLEALADCGHRLFLEIGPDAVLTRIGLDCGAEGCSWIPTQRANRPQMHAMFEALSTLYTMGSTVNWEAVYGKRPTRLAGLPTYPFQRKRFWIEELGRGTQPATPRPDQAGYPYLGDRIESPLPQPQFETLFDFRQLRCLLDTRGLVHIGIYLEMLAEAARRTGRPEGMQLTGFRVANALVIQPNKPSRVTLVMPAAGEPGLARIAGKPSRDIDRWLTYAVTQFGTSKEATTSAAKPAPPDLSDRAAMSGEAFYAWLRETRALDLGSSVARLDKIRRASGVASAEVRRSTVSSENDLALGMDPGVMDACFQLFYAVLQDQHSNDMYIFESADVFLLRPAGPGKLTCTVTLTGTTSEHLGGDMMLIGEEGRTVATASGITMRRVTEAVLEVLGIEDSGPADRPGQGLGLPLSSTATADRQTALRQWLRHRVADILGLPENELSVNVALTELGLDSLMATQIRNAVTAETGTYLPLDVILVGPTIEDVVDLILTGITDDASHPEEHKREFGFV